LNATQDVTYKSIFEPHKVTFRHPAGIVSYAMIRPPARNATCRAGANSSLPVLVGLHGAGVEAENDAVAHALDPVSDICAWVVFPTGVTPWSADDWHNWGFADVEAAVENVPSWMKQVNWTGPGIDTERWLVFGHSNGGQGTWYALTHRPDKLLAAAPLSGYASIQKYVPYELWQPADPRRTAIVSASLNSFRHEMLMENAKGVPVLQQHGGIDDNVPAYNSRLLSQLLFQTGTNSSYNEVPGRNHFWDGVMTTEPLKEFYKEQTESNITLPRQLDEFSIVVAHPGDMGSKSGIRVLALEDPGQYGRVTVKGHEIRTSNVLSLELNPKVVGHDAVDVDGNEIRLFGDSTVTIERTSGMWEVRQILHPLY
jgi:predicted esterase